MRGLLAIVVVVLLLAVAGWVTFGSDSNSTSINLETETIQQDTSAAIESGQQLLREANKEIDETTSQDVDTSTIENEN